MFLRTSCYFKTLFVFGVCLLCMSYFQIVSFRHKDEQFHEASCKRESKFSWVVSCMAKVELQFGVNYASFCPFLADYLPYHYNLSPCQSLHRDRYRDL